VKIALIGFGKMGQMFEKAAVSRGLEIAERFMDVRPLGTDPETRGKLEGISVLVDFSVPEAVLHNVRTACDLGINLVEGTTGWHEKLPEVEALVKKSRIGMVYAANFSLGVNLFYRLVDRAAQLFSGFAQYDPFIEEAHHKQKKDAPSGTALVLKRIVEDRFRRDSIPVSSVRAGYIPGLHAVSFDSPAETVRLEHRARNREGLAEGAVLAARWIEGKKGIFQFKDIVEELIEPPAKGS
jgi:4-hydroxy-tetrahydrodipicolinate reductase